MKRHLNYILPVLLLISCGQETAPTDTTKDNDLISLTDEQISFNGIEVGNLSKGPVFHTIKATGKLDVPPNYSIKLSAPVSAYISKIAVLPGDQVSKGTIIATLRDPSIAKAQEDYLTTQAALEYLERDLNRKSQLLESNAVSERDFESLKSQVVATKAKLGGLEQELVRLEIKPGNIDAERITQYLHIKAPISGTVTEVFQKVGSRITNDAPLFSLLNRDHEHVELEIFQQDVTKVKKSMPVRLSLPAEETMYDGHVFLVNAKVDSESLSSNVHVHPGEGFPVIPVGAVVFGEVVYQIDTVYRIPKKEIIREGQASFIFTKSESGFKKEEIKTGFDDGDHVEIVGPTSIFGKEIVVKGNYYLNGV